MYSKYKIKPPTKSEMLKMAEAAAGSRSSNYSLVTGNGWWNEMYIFITEFDPEPPGYKRVSTGGYSRCSENIDHIWVRDDVKVDGSWYVYDDDDAYNDDYVNVWGLFQYLQAESYEWEAHGSHHFEDSDLYNPWTGYFYQYETQDECEY